MRLINAKIKGYGRLADSKINLDSKVVAVVGPNEAGKTTLLKALAHLDEDESLPGPQRSRAVEVSDDTLITSADFVLDDDDRFELEDLGLELAPESMTVSRRAGGGAVIVDVRPRPSKDRADLRAAYDVLRELREDVDIDNHIDPDSAYGGGEDDTPRSYRTELSNLVDNITTILGSAENSSPENDIASAAESLFDGVLDKTDVERLRSSLRDVAEWMKQESPDAEVRKRLWRRTPDFVLFNESDRTLESSYTLNDALIANVPPALANLAGMAQIDLAKLLSYQQSGDFGQRRTLITQANTRVDAIFAKAWKQSRLSVWFDVDGSQLRIMIWEDGDNITVFSERSAGLRMFIALTAFLRMHGSERPPILLIDEADNHLHIDAQADLVTTFMAQQQATKVIYTTHSPACLPPDLGSGVRSVVPRADNQQISDVKNSFWQGTAGYSPLMLAMGAAAAAFTPARCVVLAEGATEMILLPSLLRSATNLPSLDYQVAPGLSEVPKDFYSKLDLEGAKVAYLIDGDEGGRSLKKGLLRAGVPEHLIVVLDVAGLENTLDATAYSEAVRSILVECNRGVKVPKLPQIVDPNGGSWAKLFSEWASGQNLVAPSKVAVATWLVENGRAIPNDKCIRSLITVHEALSQAFSP